MSKQTEKIETENLCPTNVFPSKKSQSRSLYSKESDLWGPFYPKKNTTTFNQESSISDSRVNIPWKKFTEETLHSQTENNHYSLKVYENDANTNFYIPFKPASQSPKNRKFADFGFWKNPLHCFKNKKTEEEEEEEEEDSMAPYFSIPDEL